MTPSSAPSFEYSLRAHWRMGLFLLVVAVPSVFLAATTLRVATAFTLGERGGLTELQRALSLDPANPEIHRRLGLVECYLSDPPDLSEGVKQLRQATELAPLRPLYWSDLGSACEASGDRVCADQAFAKVLSLNPMMPRSHWVVGNYYLRANQPDQAMAEFRQLLELNPEGDYAQRIFELGLRAVDDPEVIFEQVLAAQKGPERKLEFVNYLSLHDRADDAYRAWTRTVANATPFPLSLAQPYLDRLFTLRRYQDMLGAWRDLERLCVIKTPVEDHPANLVFNGGFEQAPLNTGFDWHSQEASFVFFDFSDPDAHQGERCLRLEFTVKRNDIFQPVYQVVPVAPRQEYILTAYTRSANITSDSGPRLRLFDPAHPENLDVSSETTVGTTPWHPVSLTFRTGEDMHFLLLSIWRPRGRSFPTEITGTFWVDDISLKPSGSAAQTKAPRG